MNKQTKLDDFIKDKVNEDLGFEYHEDDWNKAFKLISNQKNERVFWTFSKKIVSVVAIIIAFLFAILSKESKELASTSKSGNAKTALAQKDTHSSTLPTPRNSEVTSSTDTPKSQTETQKNVPTDVAQNNHAIGKMSNLQKSQVETAERKNVNPNNATQVNQRNGSNTVDTKSPIALVEKGTRLTAKKSELDLIDEIDYAEAHLKKSKFSFDKINPFRKLKTNTNIQDNYRNLQVTRKVVNDTTWNDLSNSTASNGHSNELKKVKPYSIQLVAGMTAYKPFSGNSNHSSSPVFAPLAGIDFIFYLNKKLSLGAGLLYTERGGINSNYYRNEQNGDSTLVVISKINCMEIPVSMVYRISKKSSCFGGIGINYYVSNKTNLPRMKAEGLIKIDGYALAGYMYEATNKLSIKLNTIIGFRDVTMNNVFKSDSREDNVGLRVTVGYKFFNHD